MVNPYFKTNHCVDRLLTEYEKHDRLVVAVDFDDTVFDFHGNGYTFQSVIDLLKRCKALGFYIVIWSASNPDRHESMRNHLESRGVEVDSVNQNPIPLPYGNHKKIYYNILLDDRAGLGQAFDVLEQVVFIAEMRKGSNGET